MVVIVLIQTGMKFYDRYRGFIRSPFHIVKKLVFLQHELFILESVKLNSKHTQFYVERRNSKAIAGDFKKSSS
jgi:hypothetical protein